MTLTEETLLIFMYRYRYMVPASPLEKLSQPTLANYQKHQEMIDQILISLRKKAEGNYFE